MWRQPSFRVLAGALVLASALGLAGCGDSKQQTSNDDMKKSLDQLVQQSKDMNTAMKDLAGGSKSSEDSLKTLIGRVDDMHKDIAGLLAKQRRGEALYVRLHGEPQARRSDGSREHGFFLSLLDE